MRVLCVGNMYPPHHLGGYELMWRAGAWALRDRGHSVRILTTDHRRADPDASIPEDPDVHRELRWYWRDHEFPRLSPLARLALARYDAGVFERQLREHCSDAVCWWAMGGMPLSLIELARRLNLPAVGFVHDDWMLYGPEVDQYLTMAGRLGPLAAAAQRLTGAPLEFDPGRAARWLFISESARDRAADTGVRLPDAGVLHAGIELDRFRLAAQAPWNWRLLYIGRLDPRKGIETAIRALADLPEQARLVVDGHGDGDYLATLRRLAAELRLDGRVEFRASEREAVHGAYAESDVVVFPVNWEEPWGLVPLEAMAVGRPVVATARGGSREYLADGENCLVFAPSEDPAALAEAVSRLAADPELRARLRQGGLQTAARHGLDAFCEGVVAEVEALGR